MPMPQDLHVSRETFNFCFDVARTSYQAQATVLLIAGLALASALTLIELAFFGGTR
jgi:hypothetical protein